MFVSRAHLRDVTERYEAQLREKDRLADILAEQIEFLRAQMGSSQFLNKRESINPSQQPPMIVDATPFMGEDEEEITAMRDAGMLDAREAEAALAQLGYLSTTIEDHSS